MPLLHEEEVRMFYHNLVIFYDGMYLTLQVNEVDMGLDEDTLSEILGPPTVGIKFVRSGKGSAQFLGMCSDLDYLNNNTINKKVLKREYQLLFELVHRVLLSKSERKGTMTRPYLYLMEMLTY